METIESLQERKVRTLEEDPQYFGGYLNMVCQNIFNISNHVAKKFNMALLGKEDDITDSFLQNSEIKSLNWNHVCSVLSRFMPLVKVFDFEQYPPKTRAEIEKRTGAPVRTKNFALMCGTLGKVFEDIRYFRNDYTHYYSTEAAAERKITVSPQTAKFLNSTFRLAIEYTKTRMTDVLKDEDYSLAVRKVMVDSENRITPEGLVFLICLFLEREQAFQFIGRVEGMEWTQYSSFVAMREVLMVLCVKLPHDKFVSEDPKQSLALDMINELSRCPKTLYNVISEEEKKRFCPKLDSTRRQEITNNSLNPDHTENRNGLEYEDYLEQLTKRIRYDNRFSYFAMRYIDEMNVFPGLRFHIDLGTLELASYKKQLAGKAEPRRIVENVRTFGKLSEYADEATIYACIDDRQRLTGGFDQFAPRYNAGNNKIGLCRKSGNALLMTKPDTTKNKNIQYRLKQPSPDAFLSLHELPKIILLEYLERGQAEKIINAFIDLSNEKLLDREFIEEVKSKLPGEWGKFKKRSESNKKAAYSERELKHLQSRKTYLNGVLNVYGLNAKQIPARILNYWLDIVGVDDDRSFSDRVKLMKRDCMERLKVMKNHRLNPGIKTPKVGEMASFLAKDIVDMVVDREKKQKITSFYYDKIQECLAFYADEEKKHLFLQILKELDMFGKGGHPFLSNVMRQNFRSTAQFYVAYLQEKANKQISQFNPKNGKTSTKDVSWMRTAFYITEWNREKAKKMTVVKMPGDTSNIPFTIRQWAKKDKQDLDKWLDNITKETDGARKAVDLPADLFDAKLCELLGKELATAKIEYDPASNYNQLLKLWWAGRGDSTQDFYRSEREYEVYGEKICFIPDSKPKFEDYYGEALRKVAVKNRRESIRQTAGQLERVFKRAIAGTEKEIRLLQEEDRLMLLMVEQMTDNVKNVQLAGIDRLLNDTVSVRLRLNFDGNGNMITDNRTSALTRTVVTACKRKNYTELRKYRYDCRLFGLFEYHQAEEVQLDWLKKQLAAYDKAKQDVFDSAFALEKQIVSKDAAGVRELFTDDEGKSESGNIRHKTCLVWLKRKGMINGTEELFLESVRNAFLHNRYPQPASIREEMEWSDGLPLAEQISVIYRQKMETIINKMI